MRKEWKPTGRTGIASANMRWLILFILNLDHGGLYLEHLIKCGSKGLCELWRFIKGKRCYSESNLFLITGHFLQYHLSLECLSGTWLDLACEERGDLPPPTSHPKQQLRCSNLWCRYRLGFLSKKIHSVNITKIFQKGESSCNPCCRRDVCDRDYGHPWTTCATAKKEDKEEYDQVLEVQD